jgi:hypothetical protein
MKRYKVYPVQKSAEDSAEFRSRVMVRDVFVTPWIAPVQIDHPTASNIDILFLPHRRVTQLPSSF